MSRGRKRGGSRPVAPLLNVSTLAVQGRTRKDRTCNRLTASTSPLFIALTTTSLPIPSPPPGLVTSPPATPKVTNDNPPIPAGRNGNGSNASRRAEMAQLEEGRRDKGDGERYAGGVESIVEGRPGPERSREGYKGRKRRPRLKRRDREGSDVGVAGGERTACGRGREERR